VLQEWPSGRLSTRTILADAAAEALLVKIMLLMMWKEDLICRP
jgi:hypothetical protein